MRRPRPAPGVRVRATMVATVIVAVVLVAGALALLTLVHRSLVGSVDAAGQARARDVAGLAASGRLQDSVASTGEESSVVQVVDAHGAVRSASSNISGEPPLLARAPAGRAPAVFSATQLPFGENPGSFRVAVQPVALPDGPGWVYVATSLSQVDLAVTRLQGLLAVGVPVVLGLMALTLWVTVGSALAPVERIRAQAERIGGADLHARLPVPASRDEIGRLARTMNQMLDRLEGSARRQQRFAGDASHELRSPLAAMRAQVDVALAHPEPAAGGRSLLRVQHEAGRMSELLDDLLFLARSDEAPGVPATPVDLDEVVLAEAQRLRSGGEVRVAVQGLRAARVPGSPRDLARAVRNLGDNAVAHARQEVTLSMAVEDGAVLVHVTDDGPGVPAGRREAIFDRFTRLDGARDRGGGGTGLGLAIARQIVERHHGRLSVGDRADGLPGAVFTLRLPVG
jgi:signal transduction histidine kinase